MLIASKYPGIDGFLGTRGSLMLDVVVIAMIFVLLVMAFSIWLARYRRQLEWHKRIQLTLGVVLLLALAAFEVDMQFLTEWEARAAESPYFPADYEAGGKWSSITGTSLAIHLCFAIPTAVVWIWVIVGALRHFPKPPAPNAYSPRHIVLARIAAVSMTFTAVSGWIFYWLAFVATQ
ncbi:MAG: DUF420 domain-containing protein [Pirellulales bacterium]